MDWVGCLRMPVAWEVYISLPLRTFSHIALLPPPSLTLFYNPILFCLSHLLRILPTTTCSPQANRTNRTETAFPTEQANPPAPRKRTARLERKTSVNPEEQQHSHHTPLQPRVTSAQHPHRRKPFLPSPSHIPLTLPSNLNSAIITIAVGPSSRLFAAHEDVLTESPYFAQACRAQFFEASGKRIDLPNEEPEVFSAVLEYLYKGDYSPKIAYDKKRASWFLEDDGGVRGEDVVQFSNNVGGSVLKDTVIYVRFLPPHHPHHSIRLAH